MTIKIYVAYNVQLNVKFILYMLLINCIHLNVPDYLNISYKNFLFELKL